MAKSTRIRMPLLSAGQAQKEVTHNEAVILLDSLLHACTPGGPSNTPPPAPELGLCYLCGPSPVGAWESCANDLACWTMAGWRFVEPFDGLELVDKPSGQTWRFEAGHWSVGIIKGAEVQINGSKVLGDQQPPIAAPAGGSVVDAQARTTLLEILAALRAHGLIAATG